MFDWLFKSSNNSLASCGSEVNLNKGMSFLKLSENQLKVLNTGSLSKVEKLGERINLSRDLGVKYEPEKFSDSSRVKNDFAWSSVHQLGFDSIMPDHFEICHDENPIPEAIDFSGKRVRKNPKYFSERDLHLLETVGKIMNGTGELSANRVNKTVENSTGTRVDQTSNQLQVANNEENPVLTEKKSWEKPLTVNSSVRQATSSKTIRSWEKPLKERYTTSADKELAEARGKIRSWEKPLTVDSAADQPANSKKTRSWEKPLEERYATSADRELAEARKKLYG